MKKISSIFLSVLMVVGSISCLMTLPASADDIPVTDYVKYDYEGYNTNDDLAFQETGFTDENSIYSDAENYKIPTFPEGDKWGLSINQGYQVYSTAGVPYGVGTWEAPIYNTNGALVESADLIKSGHQSPQIRKTSQWALASAIAVNTETLADSTYNNYVKVPLNNFTYSMGFKVTPGSEYTLTFKMKRVGTASGSGNFGHALTTTINTAQTYHDTQSLAGSYYESKPSIYPKVGAYSIVTPTNLVTYAGYYNNRSTVQAMMYNAPTVAAISTISDQWQDVTYTFSTPENGNVEKVYLMVASSATDSAVIALDDITLTRKITANKGVIVDADGVEIEDSSDYIGTTYTVNGATVDSFNDGDVVTATVEYDKVSPAYTFLGWFDQNGNKVQDGAETITFTAKAGETYTPKLKSTNILADSGSFEKLALNTDLKYPVNAETTTFSTGNKWGSNSNAGYGYKRSIFEGTYYMADGSEVVFNETYHTYTTDAQGNITDTINTTSGIGGAKVSNTNVYNGEKALKLQNGYHAASLHLDVKPNTTYSLTYKILAPAETTDKNTVKQSAIVSTVNVGTTAPVDSGVNYALTNLPSKIIFDSKEIASKLKGTWNGTTDVTGEKSDWITVTHTFTTKEVHEDAYLVITQEATKQYGAVAYIDDISMCEVKTTEDITVDMRTCASFDIISGNLKKPVINSLFQFKVVDNMETAPVVKANGVILTPDADGVYSFKVVDGTNNLSVRFDGDENLNNYDKDYEGRPLDEYNNDVYLENIWEGDTVYQESALFTTTKDKIQLLYPVDSVVSLRSYGLDINYLEGIDYEITDDGKIKRLDGSNIPVYDASKFTRTTPSTGYPLADGTGYIIYQDDANYSNFAVSVTYKHSKTFAEDEGYQPYVPESQGYEIKKTIQKLQNGEKVNIVVYGDSISCGFSSSGLVNSAGLNNDGSVYKTYNINAAPWAPTWYEMLATKLNKMYPGQVYIKTIALGGQTAYWGRENIAERLKNLYKDEQGNTIIPDLMLVGFGVNDSAGVTNEEASNNAFKLYMEGIIDNARGISEEYAEMEVLMYSPMAPNQLGSQWPIKRLLKYESIMEEIAANYEGVGLLKLTSMFNEIIKSKEPEDYLSSYLNHGNDFTARMYATGILAAMELPVNTAYNGVASLRATGKGTNADGETLSNGLRIYNEMEDKSLVSSGEIVEFGSIAIRTARLNGAELVMGTNGVATGTALKKSDNDFTTYKIWNVTDSSYIFTSYLTKIPETRYNETYSIRTYMIDKEGAVYYGEVQEVCVYDILNAIDNGNPADGSEQSQDDIDAFNKFLAEGTPAKYVEWCAANNRVTGTLYDAYISAQQ